MSEHETNEGGDRPRAAMDAVLDRVGHGRAAHRAPLVTGGALTEYLEAHRVTAVTPTGRR